MGCVSSNPARVDREDRKDHIARKSSPATPKARTPRSGRTPSSPSRLDWSSGKATKCLPASPARSDGANHSRELETIGSAGRGIVGNGGGVTVEHISHDALVAGIRGHSDINDKANGGGESREETREKGTSKNGNEQVPEGSLTRDVSLQEGTPAPTRVSSTAGEGTGSVSTSTTSPLKKELLLEAIRIAAAAEAAAAASADDEEEAEWTVEDPVESDSEYKSSISATSAARVLDLGVHISFPPSNESTQHSSPDSGRHTSKEMAPVFDPSLLVTYEEAFNEYSPTDWMNINRSGKPRRRSIEAWLKAEEKTKEAVLSVWAPVGEGGGEVAMNVGEKSPTSQFKERSLSVGREVRPGSHPGVRRVKLGETRRRSSSRFAVEEEVRRSQEVERRKSVESLITKPPYNEEDFLVRKAETP